MRSAGMLASSAYLALAAATLPLQNVKSTKYNSLVTTHHFIQIDITTEDPWNADASKFVAKLGKRLAQIALEPLETQYLFENVVDVYSCRGQKSICVQKHVQNRMIFVPARECDIPYNTSIFTISAFDFLLRIYIIIYIL